MLCMLPGCLSLLACKLIPPHLIVVKVTTLATNVDLHRLNSLGRSLGRQGAQGSAAGHGGRWQQLLGLQSAGKK